jgi:hypothetical protein
MKQPRHPSFINCTKLTLHCIKALSMQQAIFSHYENDAH